MSRYIDADKLIELANNTKDKTIDVNDIARFPAADVRENVRGEWSDYEEFDWIYKKCSVCGYNSAPREYPYCPNCGADMRGDNK